MRGSDHITETSRMAAKLSLGLTFCLTVAAGIGSVFRLLIQIPLMFAFLHHGMTWSQRRKEDTIRTQTLNEVNLMLADVIRNQLTIIAMNAQLATYPNETGLVRIEGAVSNIVDMLDDFSEDRFNAWRDKYHETVSMTVELQEKMRKVAERS